MNKKANELIARHEAAMEKGNKQMYVHAIAYAVLATLLDSETTSRQALIDELNKHRDRATGKFGKLPYDEAIDLLQNPAQIEEILR